MDRKIHIIIPCYNMARYVGETIDSVKAQAAKGWDCIIVDDGSWDNSLDVIREHVGDDSRFRVISTKNHGVAAARNRAVEEAGGGFILPLDADDLLLPWSIGRFKAELKKHPDASLLVPKIRRFGSKPGASAVQDRTWTGYEDLKERCTPTNSSLYRYDDWKRVGGYVPWSQYEDWEFWLRLLYKNDNVVNIPEVLVEYRIHPDSRWHNAVKNHIIEVELIRSMNPEIFGEQ